MTGNGTYRSMRERRGGGTLAPVETACLSPFRSAPRQRPLPNVVDMERRKRSVWIAERDDSMRALIDPTEDDMIDARADFDEVWLMNEVHATTDPDLWAQVSLDLDLSEHADPDYVVRLVKIRGAVTDAFGRPDLLDWTPRVALEFEPPATEDQQEQLVQALAVWPKSARAQAKLFGIRYHSHPHRLRGGTRPPGEPLR